MRTDSELPILIEVWRNSHRIILSLVMILMRRDVWNRPHSW
jgi:hypothetical protein